VSPVDVVLVFTADGCSHCQAVVEDFKSRNVRFREINLSREPGEMERLRSLCWEHRLPVIADHERVSIGFRGGSSTFGDLGLD
jgi:glutaredoxin